MEELAAGVENQLQDTEETTATVTDMAEGMKHIAHAAQDVFGLAATTNQLAAEGEQALIHTLAQMEGIRTSVDQSAQSVRALGEKASSIGAMGQIIIEIAEQTSLLALNASIEAARARGLRHEGQGFELQQDIVDLAGVMEQGTREVTEGMNVSLTLSNPSVN